MNRRGAICSLLLLPSLVTAGQCDHEWGAEKTSCSWDCAGEMTAKECRESGQAVQRVRTYKVCKKCGAEQTLSTATSKGDCSSK